MTDWGVHLIEIVLWGMKATGPKSVAALGGKFAYPDDAQETPDTLQTIYEFDDFTMIWEHAVGIELGPFQRGHGIAFIGNKGTLVGDRNGWEIYPEEKLEGGRPVDYKMRAKPRVAARPDARGLDQHTQNFIDCMKTREQPVCNAAVGSLAAVNAHLGNIAFRTGEKAVRFFHEHVLVKEPGTREISPWHQDQPYYCVDGEQVCSIWIPLDPVPQSVCPEFVAGSHRWNRMFTPLKFADHRPYDGAFERFEDLPDIEATRGDYEILSWALEPGDAIAFHMKTVHGAPGTATHATRRRAIATRWLGDDAVFAERPFTTSPPFPELGLEPGDPMEYELFPVVVSKRATAQQ